MKGPIELTPTERAAVDELLPPSKQSGDLQADLIAAAREAWRRRQQNTELGGAVLAALHRSAESWRAVAWATGIDVRTARRWATPPEQADADRPDVDDENGK